MINWIKNNESNIVLSTKVSLSRNLKRYPFPHKCSDDEGKDIVEKIGLRPEPPPDRRCHRKWSAWPCRPRSQNRRQRRCR